MKSKILCPRWGRCKATKKCPLSKEAQKKKGLYVFGECANKEVKKFVRVFDLRKVK